MIKKKQLEARIRVHGDNGRECLLEVALAFENHWDKNGCYRPKEAHSILCNGSYGIGQIVEAEYNGGPYEFVEKCPHTRASLVSIPDSVLSSARKIIEPDPEKFRGQLSEREKMWMTLGPDHFKPLPWDDFEYIVENCFRGQ